MKFDQDLCATCDMNSTLGSVVPLAMFVSKRRVTYFRSANFVKTGQKQIKLYETFQITLMSSSHHYLIDIKTIGANCTSPTSTF